jgi:hypothetical protein
MEKLMKWRMALFDQEERTRTALSVSFGSPKRNPLELYVVQTFTAAKPGLRAMRADFELTLF